MTRWIPLEAADLEMVSGGAAGDGTGPGTGGGRGAGNGTGLGRFVRQMGGASLDFSGDGEARESVPFAASPFSYYGYEPLEDGGVRDLRASESWDESDE